MPTETVNTGMATASEKPGSEAIEDHEGNSANNAVDGGILDVYKNTETGEETSNPDAGAETEAAEANQDLKFEISPDLMEDKTVQRFVKDGVMDVNAMAKSLVEKEKMLRNPVPEEYDIKETFEKYDLAWESDDQRDGFIKGAKEHKISQDAMNWLLEEYGQRMTAFTQEIGPLLQTDVNEEFEAVRSDWGSEAKPRFAALTEFADARPEVSNMFNMRHREGVKAAWDYYVSQRGSDLVDAGGSVSVDDLQSQLQEITDDPDYWSNPAKQRKGAEIAEKLARRQGR